MTPTWSERLPSVSHDYNDCHCDNQADDWIRQWRAKPLAQSGDYYGETGKPSAAPDGDGRNDTMVSVRLQEVIKDSRSGVEWSWLTLQCEDVSVYILLGSYS
jgi:hypothetical protein